MKGKPYRHTPLSEEQKQQRQALLVKIGVGENCVSNLTGIKPDKLQRQYLPKGKGLNSPFTSINDLANYLESLRRAYKLSKAERPESN